MSTVAELSKIINEAVCVACAHLAEEHLNHRGPCAECWVQCVKICEDFVPSEETKALLREVGPVHEDSS